MVWNIKLYNKYAADTVVILLGGYTCKSVEAVVNVFQDVEKIGGLKMNVDKTVVLPMARVIITEIKIRINFESAIELFRIAQHLFSVY